MKHRALVQFSLILVLLALCAEYGLNLNSPSKERRPPGNPIRLFERLQLPYVELGPDAPAATLSFPVIPELHPYGFPPGYFELCVSFFEALAKHQDVRAWSMLTVASQALAIRDSARALGTSEEAVARRFASGDSSILARLFDPIRLRIQRARAKTRGPAAFQDVAEGSRQTHAIADVRTNLLPSEDCQNDCILLYRCGQWRIGLLEALEENRFTPIGEGASELRPTTTVETVQTFFRALLSEEENVVWTLLSASRVHTLTVVRPTDGDFLLSENQACRKLSGARVTCVSRSYDRALVRVSKGAFLADFTLFKQKDGWHIDWFGTCADGILKVPSEISVTAPPKRCERRCR
jgi:hypothetical protein